jgi:hypothetical protein
MMQLSPVVAILSYADEEQTIPASYVIVGNGKFIAVVEDAETIKMVGQFDSRADAIRALFRDHEQVAALYHWPEREHRPN